MKRLLLASTALIGFVAATSPAVAEINMDLGGHFRGYAVYNDNDEVGAADSLHSFDFRRDTEIHFTGEATSDNGLTVGAHYEGFVGGDIATDEAYAYFSGNWGRVNFGSEDGAAYLLQVAAPSADSNVDGLRVNVQNINATGLDAATVGVSGVTGYTGVLTDAFSSNVAGAGSLLLDYDHADFQDTERLTYLSPKYMGFQGGLSYAPEAGQKLIGNGLAQATQDDDVNEFEDLWEASLRWDGEFEGFGISAGAGYSNASVEQESVVLGDAADDLDTWNVGLNVAFQGFSVGGAWLNSDTEVGDGAAGAELESDTWVIGAAWDNGPYHVGVSYLDQEIDVAGAEIEADKATIGAGYTYGPGMSFRGAVAFGSVDENITPTDEDFTQVTVGTDIQF